MFSTCDEISLKKGNGVSLTSLRSVPTYSRAQTPVCKGKELASFQISVDKVIFSLSHSIFLGNLRGSINRKKKRKKEMR